MLEESHINGDAGVFLTYHKTNKLEGLYSINTSSIKNDFCQKMSRDDDKICSSCYARRQEKIMPPVQERYESNGKILSGEIIPRDDLPDLDSTDKLVRLHSFGEIIDEAHAINFTNIIRKNPDVQFSWYTKRPEMLKSFRGQKPDNVVIVYSNPFTNTIMRDINIDIVDKIFNVVDVDYKRSNDIDINCAANSCNKCRRCYKKDTSDVIVEQLK